jgi:hypothetical protein
MGSRGGGLFEWCAVLGRFCGVLGCIDSTRFDKYMVSYFVTVADRRERLDVS